MIVTRFAPSPTGYLHIGGARTAIFNWLYARRFGGRFILRIEDTDIKRSQRHFTEAIIEDLSWLGIDWDEGPYFQSKRLDLYNEALSYLLKTGKVYRCYCTEEELLEMRKRALALGKRPGYDGRCRNRKDFPKDKPYVLRFKVEGEEEIVVNDLIKGRVVFRREEIDDFIVARSDGTPTYNFTVVFDDHHMGITHIIRGDDHLNNTPKQILIYRAFFWDVPKFAHVPMILGEDRKRLSKRHGAESISEYREKGYLPEALLNYLVRLGWSHGDKEIFSKDELLKMFDISGIGRSQAIFDPKKLLWLNGYYIREKSEDELVKLLIPYLQKRGILDIDENYLKKVIRTLKTRSKTLLEMVEQMLFYFVDNVEIDENDRKKFINQKTIHILEDVKKLIMDLSDFSEVRLEKAFREFCKDKGIKLVEVAQPTSVCLCGRSKSPGLFEMMEILGKDRCLERIEKVILSFAD